MADSSEKPNEVVQGTNEVTVIHVPRPEHAVGLFHLDGHSHFHLRVHCTCGWTVYAVNDEQGDQHKQYHLEQVKNLKARQALAAAKESQRG